MGAQALDRLRRGRGVLGRHASPSRWPSRCGRGTTCGTAATTSTSSTTTSPSATACWPSSAIGLPVIATIHHPITVDRRLELEHAADPLQAAHAASLVPLHRRCRRGSPSGSSGSSPCRRTRSPTSTATTRCRLDRMHIVPVGVDPELFRPVDTVERQPGRLITTASADVTMKGLRYLLEALAKLRTERDLEPHGHRPAQGGRRVGPDHRRARPHRRRRVRVRRVRRAHRRAVLGGRAGGRALAVRGLLVAGHRGHVVRRAARGHHRRRDPRGGRPRRRHRASASRPATARPWRPRSASPSTTPSCGPGSATAGRQRVIDHWSWRHTAEQTVEQYRARWPNQPTSG